MAKPPLSLNEALAVCAEGRALLGAAIGPEQQKKAKAMLDAGMDAALALLPQPEKAEEKPVEKKKPAAKAEQK